MVLRRETPVGDHPLGPAVSARGGATTRARFVGHDRERQRPVVFSRTECFSPTGNLLKLEVLGVTRYHAGLMRTVHVGQARRLCGTPRRSPSNSKPRIQRTWPRASISEITRRSRDLPYGQAGNDWLSLDSRRVNNPTLRLSNNQVVGYVLISRETNPELRDQTNREGLIDNQALTDLCDELRTVISQLETERHRVRPGRNRSRILARAASSLGST